MRRAAPYNTFIMKNSNIVVAIMCLEKAGDLLKYFYPDISTTLTQLADRIKEENLVSDDDKAEVENTVKEIVNG